MLALLPHIGQIFSPWVWEEQILPCPGGGEGSQSSYPETGWEPLTQNGLKESTSMRTLRPCSWVWALLAHFWGSCL